MIPLSDPLMSLQAVLSGAVSATQPTVQVGYYDMPWQQQSSATSQIPAWYVSALNNTTDVIICPAPGDRYPQGARVITGVTIYNGDTASVTVTVFTDDGTTERTLRQVTLPTLCTLNYESGRGWYVTMSNGAILTSDLTYASGSWTPVLTFATAGDLSVAYTTQFGRYIRIGDQVTAWFVIVTSSFTHTTASGNCQVTGVPITSVSDTNSGARSTLQWAGITKANYTDICATLNVGSTTLAFAASGSGQSAANITATDMPTGGTVTFAGSITYRAA